MVYEWFSKLHVALAALSVYSVWRHVGGNLGGKSIYLIVEAGLLLLLTLLRTLIAVYKNWARGKSWTSAKLLKRSEAVELQINLPRPWRVEPGHFIYLWSPAVSFWSFCQSHPFTIAWWVDDDGGYAT